MHEQISFDTGLNSQEKIYRMNDYRYFSAMNRAVNI